MRQTLQCILKTTARKTTKFYLLIGRDSCNILSIKSDGGDDEERTSPRPNLTGYVADLRRKKRSTFLDDIEQIVDWHPLEKLLRRKLRWHKDAVGNPAYPPLLMFKIYLLQR